MERHVMMKLRIAQALDFSNQAGEKKIGTLYFQLNSEGVLERLPRYFTAETDLELFRQLYANKQIYVPVNPLDEIALLEEWEEDEDMKSA